MQAARVTVAGPRDYARRPRQTLGNAEQVIGTVCLGRVALRLLRLLVVFVAAGRATLDCIAAVNSVFDPNLFGIS